MERFKVRTSPRLSLNQIALYMRAGPVERRRILQDGKFPRGGLVAAYYREASEAVSRSLAAGGQDHPLRDAIASLAPHGNARERRRRADNRAVLERARMTIASAPFGSAEPRLGPHRAEEVLEGGITVSVRPEIELWTHDGIRVGAGKLYLKKTQELEVETGQTIAWLLYEWLGRCGVKVERKNCWVYDVHAGVFHGPPRAVKMRSRAFEAACAEIAAAWGGISPPAGA